MTKKSIYNTWEDINIALRELGEAKIKKEKLDGELTIKINELKAQYADKCKELIEKIDSVEKNITSFCNENKSDFIDKRNKKLDFGKISYRATESCECSNVDSIIKSLKCLDLDSCIRVKEELDKDELKKLDVQTLTKIGVSIIRNDKLTIEPNAIKIAAGLSNTTI